MTFADSYLGQLRAEVGHRLLIMPGAAVLLVRDGGDVLLTHRTDLDVWGFPGGSAEAGGSFGRTAVRELEEETGVVVREDDLVAFATLSEAENNTVIYPNGDLLHGFSVCFMATRWSGDPVADGVEMSEVRFVDPAAPPAPRHPTTTSLLELFVAYRATGIFQVR